MTRSRNFADDPIRFTRDLSKVVVRVKTVDLKPGMVMDRLPNPGWKIDRIIVEPNPRHDFVYGYATFASGPGSMTLSINDSHNIYANSIN